MNVCWLATKAMLEAGHDSACVLNSDSPTLPSAYLQEAARLLAQPGDRGVLGPSTDGGYYLLGLKQAHARMFADIAWSTETVAEQTLERAREIGLEMQILPTWYDVDDADGLRSVVADLKLAASATGGHEAAYQRRRHRRNCCAVSIGKTGCSPGSALSDDRDGRARV